MTALSRRETHTMDVQFHPEIRTADRRLPLECVALVLQGGGALGAYQAGVYEALTKPTSVPTGSPASPSAPSAQSLSRETSDRVAKLRTCLAGDHGQPGCPLGSRVVAKPKVRFRAGSRLPYLAQHRSSRPHRELWSTGREEWQLPPTLPRKLPFRFRPRLCGKSVIW
jgi:hypothetical protein